MENSNIFQIAVDSNTSETGGGEGVACIILRPDFDEPTVCWSIIWGLGEVWCGSFIQTLL